jgi:hypothetical protein
MLESGQLGPDDLVYAEGEAHWRPLIEYSEFNKFSELAKSRKTGPRNRRPLKWVLLERKDKSSFKQRGPYTSKEVRDFLLRGEIKLSDYLWREGMKEWYRVQTLYEQIMRDTEAFVPSVEPSGEELLKNVMKEAPDTGFIMDSDIEKNELPAEAIGPDLAKIKVDPRDEIFKKLANTQKPKPQAPAVEVKKPIAERIIKPKINLLYIALTVFLTIAFGSGFYILVTRTAKNTANKMADSQRLAKNTKLRTEPLEFVSPKESLPGAGFKATPEPSPTPQIEAKKAPTYIKLIKSRESGREILVVATNGSSHYPIKVEWISVRGTVIGYKSFRLLKTLKKLTDREIDLSTLGLPAGRYEVLASIKNEGEEYKSKEMLSHGLDAENYKKRLLSYNKSVAFEFSLEKISVLNLLRRFKEILSINLDAINAGKKVSSSAVMQTLSLLNGANINKITYKNRNQYAFAKELYQLIDIKVKVANTKSDDLKARLTSDLNALDQLTELVQRASLWD